MMSVSNFGHLLHGDFPCASSAEQVYWIRAIGWLRFQGFEAIWFARRGPPASHLVVSFLGRAIAKRRAVSALAVSRRSCCIGISAAWR
jgi:hypothetical protein